MEDGRLARPVGETQASSNRRIHPGCAILSLACNSARPHSKASAPSFQRPSFGFAEIAWRWSFGAAAGVLLVFSFFEYLDTLPVSNGDLLLLRTRQPLLISRAVLDIFRGSSFRLFETVAVPGADSGSCVGGCCFIRTRCHVERAGGSFSRERCSASLQHEEKSWRLPSLFALNFFRLGATLAAAVGCLAAVLLGAAASRPSDLPQAAHF